MFKNIFIGRLKCFIREKSLVFWTLLFPLVLATFFNIAFSNIKMDNQFEIIPLGVVNNSKYQESLGLINLIDSLTKEDENKVFDVSYVNEEEAEELLKENKIIGYIIINDKLNLIINKSGIEATITKSIFDNYLQVSSSLNTIISINPEAIKNDVLDIAYNQNDYINETGSKKMDPVVLYYYSLIGMVCMYSGFWGLKIINESQANLSSLGARISVSPTHKLKLILSSFLAAYFIQVIIGLIVLAYLNFGLKIDFGNEIGRVILLTLTGSLAGMSVGTLIGTSPLKSENAKISVFITISMLLSFLSGLMYLDIKYIIAENVPFLNYINPATLITDGLYSLYYYDTYTRYNINVVTLLIFSLVSYFGVYLLIRRQKYESI